MYGCQEDGVSFMFQTISWLHGYLRTLAKTNEGIEEAVRQAAKDILHELGKLSTPLDFY